MTNDRAVEWMAERGLTSYKTNIEAIESQINEVIGDAGRYWQQCEFTTNRIAAMKNEIDEIKQAARE